MGDLNSVDVKVRVDDESPEYGNITPDVLAAHGVPKAYEGYFGPPVTVIVKEESAEPKESNKQEVVA